MKGTISNPDKLVFVIPVTKFLSLTERAFHSDLFSFRNQKRITRSKIPILTELTAGGKAKLIHP